VRGTDLKFDSVLVRDSEGDRRYGIDKLPLKLGTGGDCAIRLPGPGSVPAALIDELDGKAFIQPIGRNPSLTVNAQPLTASRRLDTGDVIGFYGSRIVVQDEQATLVFRIRLEDSAYVTKPPPAEGLAGEAAEERIAPTAFRRAGVTGTVETRSSAWRWQSAVAAGIVALLLLSYLLFSARSIRFDIQPGEPDSFSISGGWFTLPFGDRTLMREGSYTVHVRKEGYYDVDQALVVDATESRTVLVEMRKLPGQLSVSVEPDVDALITVDDTRVGKAPFGPIELEPGLHSVAVSAEGYLPFADRFDVPGLGRHQQVSVLLVPRWANVEITSEPPGAAIYEGVDQLGQTPTTLQLMEGSHTLSVVLEGFKAWDGSVVTAPNEHQVLPLIRLEPANAQLQVNTIPRGANVTVNGNYRGQSPIRIALSPDINYEIGLSKAGYGSMVRRVRLAAAAAEAITVDLTARVGEVRIEVLPGDAQILVDGQSRGTGSMTLRLSSAPHQLEVQRDGYQSFSRSVTPRPGYPQTIPVRLLSDEEVRAQRTAVAATNSQGQVLVRVEPGSFVMGSSRREQGRRANEVIVPVTLSKAFFIGAKEVTNKEFNRFRANHLSGEGVHPSLAGDLNPVVNVSWSDAVDYCNWLSAEEGLTPAYVKKFEQWQPVSPVPDGYRLPTEAEWEWAIRYQARSNALTFPWGDRLPPRKDSGNYADKSAKELVPSVLPGYDDGFASTSPVGSFAANVLGIYDGGGNVAEWVQDYYSVPTPGQVTPVVDPTGPERGANHVIRGSSWRHSGVTELRLSYRDYGSNGRIDVGFRIARSID
jgi:formylglycine-generating enzyme required for sulfatase activity